jgi:LemA protein
MTYIGLFIFIIVLGFTVLSFTIGIYNALIALRNQVDRSWANIDVLLKQRYDEIPQLVSLCEQYAQYEKNIFEKLTNARTRYLGARTLDQKIHSANELSEALSGVMANVLAIGEAYPDLKTSSQFIELQKRISALESQLSDRRELFNETVTNFNTRIQQIPDVFIANILQFKNLELFKVMEHEKTTMPNLKMNLK